jgi:hypothetical protein
VTAGTVLVAKPVTVGTVLAAAVVMLPAAEVAVSATGPAIALTVACVVAVTAPTTEAAGGLGTWTAGVTLDAALATVVATLATGALTAGMT